MEKIIKNAFAEPEPNKIVIEKPMNDEEVDNIIWRSWCRLRKMDVEGLLNYRPTGDFREDCIKRLEKWGFNRVFIPANYLNDDNFTEIIRIVKEYDSELIVNEEELLNKKLFGMKVGRYLRKILMEGIRYDKNFEKAIERQLPRLLDYTQKGYLVISNYPRDLLFPNLGNFRSCLSQDGEYRSGVISYMRSLDYLLVYFTKGDEKSRYQEMFRRVWRAYTVVGEVDESKIIAFLRTYPLQLGENEAKYYLKLIRKFFFPELSAIDFDYVYEDENDVDTEKFMVLLSSDLANHSVLSADRTYFDGYRYALLQNNKNMGEWLKAANCQFNIEKPICYTCGNFNEARDSIHCYYCWESDKEGFTCYNCGDFYEGEPYSWYDGEPLCQYCYEEFYFYCDSCQDILPNERCCIVRTPHGTIYLCSSCVEQDQDVWGCERCGEYYDSELMYIVYDKNGNEHYLCENCKDYNDIWECDYCDEYAYSDAMVDVLIDGTEYVICPLCQEHFDTDSNYNKIFDEEELMYHYISKTREEVSNG